MSLRVRVGRFLLSILFSCIFFTCMLAVASPQQTGSNAKDRELLLEVKKATVELIERQKKEAETLHKCFSFKELCDPELAERMPAIRQVILDKTAEYRLLVGLSRATKIYRGSHTFKLSLSIPAVTLDSFRNGHAYSEIEAVHRIHREDIKAIKANRDFLLNKGITPLMHADLDQRTPGGPEISKIAEDFYETQALMLATQLPFVIYLENDVPTDRDISKALATYVRRIQNVLTEVFDEEKNPLESFLMYAPIVDNVMKKKPELAPAMQAMIARHKAPAKGFQGWVNRNSPSLKFAAFTTCSLVAAILQSWPVSIACTGSLAVLTSQQLYHEYYTLKENFSMWLIGGQNFQALKDNESRLIYSTFALFLSGQALGSTIMTIETGLIASLSAIPSTAAARFTSLQALREGGLRFASRTVNFKGRDLGASILSDEFFDNISEDVRLPREQRIFTYADFLKLSQEALNANLP